MIEPQEISLTQYNSNREAYGLIDTWIKFNKFGKEYFLDKEKKIIKMHLKWYLKKHPKEKETYTQTYTQSSMDRFNKEFDLFLEDIKGLTLYFDPARLIYVIEKNKEIEKDQHE